MVTLLDLFSENNQIEKWHQNLIDKKKTTNTWFYQRLLRLLQLQVA